MESKSCGLINLLKARKCSEKRQNYYLHTFLPATELSSFEEELLEEQKKHLECFEQIFNVPSGMNLKSIRLNLIIHLAHVSQEKRVF